MKNVYFALTFNRSERFRSECFVMRSHHDNAWAVLDGMKNNGLINATICDTKKHMIELVDTWNDQWKSRGVYLDA